MRDITHPTAAVLGIALLICAAPVAAWQFTADPLCKLSDAGSETQVDITYDGALYTLHLTHAEGWPAGPVFSITFLPSNMRITTHRHVIEGRTLSVSDTGFGNVLQGLGLNRTAIAAVGNSRRVIDLAGAAAPTAEFATCRPVAATS